MNDYGTDLVDPDLYHYRTGQFEEQWTGGSNADFDKLYDAWKTEPDQDKRLALIKDIQRNVLANVREIYLYSPPNFTVTSNKIIGLEPWPGSPGTLRAFDWEQVYVTA